MPRYSLSHPCLTNEEQEEEAVLQGSQGQAGRARLDNLTPDPLPPSAGPRPALPRSAGPKVHQAWPTSDVEGAGPAQEDGVGAGVLDLTPKAGVVTRL